MNEQQKVAQVLADAGRTVRKVAAERNAVLAENAELKQKLANVQTRLLCEKVAADMHTKGLRTDTEFGDLVDSLEKAAGEGRLPAIIEGVKMAAPDMGGHFTINDEASGGTVSDLEAYLIGSVG